MAIQRNRDALHRNQIITPEPAGIAVVTITFNDLSGLESTSKSMRQQTVRPTEWIVIDGGSTDGTVNYLKSLEKDATKVVSEPDNGIYDAMNKGISLASAPWIIFLNSGDMLHDEQTLAAISGSLANAEGVGVFYGDTIVFDTRGREFIKRGRPSWLLRLNNISHHQSFVYRRCLFADSAYGAYNLSYPISADYEFHCRLFSKGIIFKYMGFPVARCQSGGVSDIKWLERESELAEIRARTFPGGQLLNWGIAAYRPIVEMIKRNLPATHRTARKLIRW